MGIVVDTLILEESPTKFIERECKTIKDPFSEETSLKPEDLAKIDEKLTKNPNSLKVTDQAYLAI